MFVSPDIAALSHLARVVKGLGLFLVLVSGGGSPLIARRILIIRNDLKSQCTSPSTWITAPTEIVLSEGGGLVKRLLSEP